ncbi:MAG: hypothetical protein M3299_13025 [Thermoproteota archaeon]|nr:hypothetical protein [Thermoproteota archaeon]
MLKDEIRRESEIENQFWQWMMGSDILIQDNMTAEVNNHLGYIVLDTNVIFIESSK